MGQLQLAAATSLTGELPEGPAFVLASSLTVISAITSGMLGWNMRTR